MDMYNPLIGSSIINMSVSGGRKLNYTVCDVLHQWSHLVAGHRYLFTCHTLHVDVTTRVLASKCRRAHACLLQLTYRGVTRLTNCSDKCRLLRAQCMRTVSAMHTHVGLGPYSHDHLRSSAS